MTAIRFSARLLWVFVAALIFQAVHAKPSGEVSAYHDAGKGRVHVDGCQRLSKDPAERAKLTKMTLAEAKGQELCSKCPGSTTPGKGKPEGGDGGTQSWVNPAPGVIEKTSFIPSRFAPLVSSGNDGRLVYKPYPERGDRILDWSHCGFRQSEVTIPFVPVVETLEPLPGEAAAGANMAYPMGPDSRVRIQVALERVAAMKPSDAGVRGAVLLKRGTYYLNGGLRVPSGVVLRGEGDDENGTVLVARSAEGGGNAIEVGNPAAVIEHVGESSSVRITDSYVPSGSSQVAVRDASQFKAGDFVCVRKTVNQAWIDLLGMGERLRHIRGGKEGLMKRPWKPESYQFSHYRRIARVDANTIILDAMLPQSFEAEHGGGEVFKVNTTSLATHAGVESLRLVSNYDTRVQDEGKDFGHALMGSGHIESPDQPVKPDSLFEQQLFDRIGRAKAEKVLQSLMVRNQAAAQKQTAEVIFEDSMMGDWQENWFLDGKKATLEHQNGGLYFSGGTVTKDDDPQEYHAHHAAIWTKRIFEGDLRISYQMKRMDHSDYGNTLLYIQAQGIGTPPYLEDIHEWRNLREVPDMSKYFTYMDLLSLSFRENIRCKRYPLRDESFKSYPAGGLIEPMVNYPGLTPGEIYQVLVEKTGDSLRLRLHDESVGRLHVDHTWDTSRIDEGIEPRHIQKGRIGIRHMATKQFIYKNFKVEQL